MSDIRREIERTTAIQSRASDPTTSVWVAANAGTGKTHVLTQRVLRILLDGSKPDRILCLTYTKAAAAEMSARVFAELARWVTAEPAMLDKALTRLLTRTPTREEAARARTLFATAIETPGGLKVQTIHAFCEQLLQRFPLEANVPPGFEVLDEETAATLRREAIDHVLRIATSDRASPLGSALMCAIAYATDDGFDDKLRQALQQRVWIEAAHRLDEDSNSDPLAAAEIFYRRAFGVRAGVNRERVEIETCALLSDATLARLRFALSEGSANDRKMAEAVSGVIAAKVPAQRCRALATLLLTKDNEPKADRTLATQAVQSAHPDVLPTLQRARDNLLALDRELGALDAIAATTALLRLADAVLARYSTLKTRRAGLDFEDLIQRTCGLLRTADAAEWVLYKLDGGLDHILVDESQDTSPGQWQIVEALANEFYFGSGQSEKRRTVFAVGDEKQSIYSFQGAAPDKFAEMGKMFGAMAAQAKLAFARLPLTMSFRTVAPVLDAVDRVFADTARTPGVGTGEAIHHVASRAGQAGFLEIWPSEPHLESETGDVWSPLSDKTAASPVERVAERIARTVETWLKAGEQLTSERRPVRAGDILILVRRRRPFAASMVAALKRRGIPVAGADRIRLTEQIAVEDLVALGDFLVLPDDDLALATVLKSPLIGLDDDDLMAIAPHRRGSLWTALIAAAPGKARWSAAVEQLKSWRRRADLNPPFEFYAALLDRDGGRKKLLARLGPDAADPLDEFLNLALAYDEREPPSLTGFLDWLRGGEREIKRDMEHGRDEVRVMTVHGAKGLEAPIVFLPDTCSAGNGRTGGDLLTLHALDRPMLMPPPFVWPIKGSSRLDLIRDGRRHLQARERDEHNRLLYVAMTRARDRLYVCGFESRRGRASGCWYDTIAQGLADCLVEIDTGDGKVRRLEAHQSAQPEATRVAPQGDTAPIALPEWATRPAPSEPHLAVPIAPSRFVPYETDYEADPIDSPALQVSRADREPSAPSPLHLATDNRFLRGTLTHALLQHLPTMERRQWRPAAEAFVVMRGRDLTVRQRRSIVTETLAVLEAESFAALFGPDSRAEVPLAGVIPRPNGKQPPLHITGQIDRLAVTDREVLIVDYKTNRPPPAEPDQVAEAYLYQLAAYRLVLQQIFPGKAVRAAILWTDGPRMMPVPDRLLDERQSRLWDLDPARLDAEGGPP